MYIKTTGEIIEGICDIKKDNCKAIEKGIVTKVFSPNEGNKGFHVCNYCLNILLKERIWNIRGASTPEMKTLVDLAVIDKDKNILIAFELKNWKEKGIEKGKDWAIRMKDMTFERMESLNTTIFVLATFEGLYIFRKNIEMVFINLEDKINTIIQNKSLSDTDIFITERSEFTKSPELVDLKHDNFIDFLSSCLKNSQIIDILPIEVSGLIQKYGIIKKYTV